MFCTGLERQPYFHQFFLGQICSIVLFTAVTKDMQSCQAKIFHHRILISPNQGLCEFDDKPTVQSQHLRKSETNVDNILCKCWI